MLRTRPLCLHTTATGKMRTCGSADFATGSGENYGLRLRLGLFSVSISVRVSVRFIVRFRHFQVQVI